MIVYRITLAKFSKSLYASGNAARWNSKDVKMIYSTSGRALACLENLVHRSSIGLSERFRTMIIEIPDKLKITVFDKNVLDKDWYEFANYPYTQNLGDDWIQSGIGAVMQVPSAIIPEEFNYLINPGHPDFSKIKLIHVEPFVFDPRIKGT